MNEADYEHWMHTILKLQLNGLSKDWMMNILLMVQGQGVRFLVSDG
ncbi:hypothetical protein KHA80_07465 [Anaerobacillus sp. HL2]|nr:hypothetical protein KHA80_07465 [Anaerobacillus sp. HL2]